MSEPQPVRVSDVMTHDYQTVDGMMTIADAIEKIKTTGAVALIVDKRHDNDEYGIVLLGDRRYIRPETLKMIPGIQLVDRDFVLRADGGGVRAPDNIYSVVIPKAARELGVPDPSAEATLADLEAKHLPPTGPRHPAAARLFALLARQPAQQREQFFVFAAVTAP